MCCAAHGRHPRCRQTRRLPCACWESLRSLTSTGSGYARSCRRRSHRRAVQLSIIAWWWKACCGSFALARPGVNYPSASGRGRRSPAVTNAGVKRACGRVSCRSCFRLRLRSYLRLESFKWDCSTRRFLLEMVGESSEENRSLAWHREIFTLIEKT